jgi:hypothetical protein
MAGIFVDNRPPARVKVESVYSQLAQWPTTRRHFVLLFSCSRSEYSALHAAANLSFSRLFLGFGMWCSPTLIPFIHSIESQITTLEVEVFFSLYFK